MVMTALILFVTASSLYAVILGYSRILFAAARDGQFFAPFARLHPTKHFPHVSLLTIGAVAMPFCFFSPRAARELADPGADPAAVHLAVRRGDPAAALPARHRRSRSRMWLYPLPALVSLAMWLYIFVSAPAAGIVFSVAFLAVAVAVRISCCRVDAEKKTAAPWSGSGRSDFLIPNS